MHFTCVDATPMSCPGTQNLIRIPQNPGGGGCGCANTKDKLFNKKYKRKGLFFFQRKCKRKGMNYILEQMQEKEFLSLFLAKIVKDWF